MRIYADNLLCLCEKNTKRKKQTTIKQKLIQDANYDDYALQPGDDREFKNQFTEFLQKNIPTDEKTSEPIKKTTTKGQQRKVRRSKQT